MAELDNLLGSRISLITQQDIRYEGVLFSINQNESSIVLRDGKLLLCEGTTDKAHFMWIEVWIYDQYFNSACEFVIIYAYYLVTVRYFGTEDRPVEKKIAGNEAVLAFVSFPGNEIKDLYVHEGDEAAPKEDKVEENSETKTR